MRMYGMDSMPKGESTLIINTTSPLIKKLENIAQNDSQKASEIAAYLYKLSLLSQKKFTAEEMQDFMRSAVSVMMML